MPGANAPDTSDQDVSQPTVVRLKRRPQFLFARSGTSYRTKSMVVQARRRPDWSKNGQIGEGFTATKKIGNAVLRNRAKRRLKAAARQLLPIHGRRGVDYVFIARQQTASLAWARLLDDMEKALLSLACTFDENIGTSSPPKNTTPG